MKFGSWTFTGDQVSLSLFNNKNHVDLSDYWKSGTWDIIEVPAYLNVHNNTGITIQSFLLNWSSERLKCGKYLLSFNQFQLNDTKDRTNAFSVMDIVVNVFSKNIN